ncbi:glutathione peroxidase [Prolixibacteraceae bacterium Z1-6]|uniref:Glutathione peroxidase n=1 Tax=Draconibacterium aestuarii TaxID=2998507 RepID=A0A9X3F938_9BACT|nr:glutathione peroxidase [Prolixibacteraceae bacterium Z1-6]
MKKIASVFLFVLVVLGVSAQQKFYDFTVKDIEGNDFEFAKLKGKKVLVVNTASKCGLTPQYKQLQALYETYGGDDFVIIGFPANNFANQEPGTNEEIVEFCERNYGVSFPMMEKISVKGDDKHPLYQWLTQKEKNGKMDSEVRWNFQKYLIDKDGNLVDLVEPKVKPDDKRILSWIQN